MNEKDDLEGYRKLNSVLYGLSRQNKIKESLEIALTFDTVHSELAQLLPVIIEDVPKESFDTYISLLEKSFSSNSLTSYESERMYKKIVGLLDLYIAKTEFLKALQNVSKKRNFDAYTSLLERLFSDNMGSHEAKKQYKKFNRMIDSYTEKTEFLKSALQVVDKEVCCLEDALPPNHPYLETL